MKSYNSKGFFFFSSRRRHTRLTCDWSSDVCSSDLSLEVHLLDYNGNLYGRNCIVEFVQRLRPEQTFPGIDDRSEERRVGKECRSGLPSYQKMKKVSAPALSRKVHISTKSGAAYVKD